MIPCPGATPWRFLRRGSTARSCAPLTTSATSGSVSVFRPARCSTADGCLSAPSTRWVRRKSVSSMEMSVRCGLPGTISLKRPLSMNFPSLAARKKVYRAKNERGKNMQPDLNRVIEQVSKEKGMDRSVIIEALESAMLSAARRTFSQKRIEAKFSPDLGEVELFEIKTVVDTVTNSETEVDLATARNTLDPEAQVGDELLSKLPATAFGRIAAQVAKQSVIQKVREAERELIYNEFKNRKGELFSGIVQRVEKKNIIVNLGRTDAVLPEKEQIPYERYRQGDRIRAYILDVEMSNKGPQIILSRTHPGFLIKLFEQEAPEVYEGIVEIKSAAREPGSRAKIAVHSTDPDVDPVGACVGMKGTRVQSVVQELRGERVDIVPWTPDPAEDGCRALLQAQMTKNILE